MDMPHYMRKLGWKWCTNDDVTETPDRKGEATCVSRTSIYWACPEYHKYYIWDRYLFVLAN
jgi:hypothetical protein